MGSCQNKALFDEGEIKKMVSIIIPVYNEEKNLEALQKELKKVLDSLVKNYEIIYVDDGSKDNSSEVLKRIVQCNIKTSMVQLSRHYGQTEAIQAGIDFSKGQIVVFLDADLQNDPEDIPKLLDKIKEGFDVVSGWRKKRKDSFFTKRLPSYIANFLISLFSKVKLHDYGCSLKAYRKDAIKQIRLYGEMHRFLPMYVARGGASITEIQVSHRRRFSGTSKYTLMRIPKVILDFFVAEFINSYLTKPMYIFGMGGFFLFFLGSLLGILIILRRVFFGGIWVSPTLFIMVMCIIIGFQFVLMGFLAEISIRLYYKTSGERTYSVKRVMEKETG